jgi:RNA polymerase sigma-70 factor (sigma-E family)
MRRRPRGLTSAEAATGELSADRTAAVTELFQAHYPQLVRLARFLVDDAETAEDVVMDAFVALHRRWSAIRDPHDAYRYVRSCVLNGARSQLRRRRVVRLHQAATAVPPSGLPVDPDVATAGSTRATVMALLRTLPNRQRQVLVLRYFANLSESEIADALGISPGSVKTHAARGMSAMAQALGEVR